MATDGINSLFTRPLLAAAIGAALPVGAWMVLQGAGVALDLLAGVVVIILLVGGVIAGAEEGLMGSAIGGVFGWCIGFYFLPYLLRPFHGWLDKLHHQLADQIILYVVCCAATAAACSLLQVLFHNSASEFNEEPATTSREKGSYKSGSGFNSERGFSGSAGYEKWKFGEQQSSGCTGEQAKDGSSSGSSQKSGQQDQSGSARGKQSSTGSGEGKGKAQGSSGTNHGSGKQGQSSSSAGGEGKSEQKSTGPKASADRGPYEILGIPKHADQKTVKSAWSKAIRKAHPDRSDDPNATLKTQMINKAYQDILCMRGWRKAG